jgi:CheY-like chemotaxis protein
VEAARRLVESGATVDFVVAAQSATLVGDTPWPAEIRLRALWQRAEDDDSRRANYLIQPVKAAALRAILLDALQAGLAERRERQSTAPAIVAPPRPVRILVAEDTVVNQVVIRRMLDRLGYEADVVASGTEALAALVARPYDLVFMDMQMPDMDGLEATRRIRRLEADRGDVPVQVIALTANVSPEDRAACFEAGMNSFLGKPLRIEELRTVLHAATAELSTPAA